ncbi:unnamed protein product [Symbiodinium sp. KB8]|nr:unnamed protein product [Symbiodinium sp. KB8]
MNDRHFIMASILKLPSVNVYKIITVALSTFFREGIRETRNEESERDRKFKQKVLEGIMAELRREVDRLDEDAWMFKKLDF